MRKAIIGLTSVTYAIRAQKLLESRGIRSAIKKTTQSAQMNGCVYGLEISENDLSEAASAVSSAGIRIVNIIK